MRLLPIGPEHEFPDHPFDSAEHRDLFLQLVREHLDRDGRQVQIEDGVASFVGGAGRMGLQNLAQTCRQQPTCLWPQTIAEHLDLSAEGRMLPMLHAALDSGFDEIADRLALRVHGEDYAQRFGQLVVWRTDLPCTATVLVLDLGGSMLSVMPALLEQWGVPQDEAFARALRNVAAMPSMDWERWPLPPGCEIDVMMCGHDYTTSHVLRLAECLPRRGRHGNLIGIPHRRLMLSHPIDGEHELPITRAMLGLTIGMYRDGPGSISPHLFWHRPDGGFEVQRAIGTGRTRLGASPGFEHLLRRLRQGAR